MTAAQMDSRTRPASTIDIGAPAPWELRGNAYVSMLRFPQQLLDEASFVPGSLCGQRRPSPFGYLMFADYSESPVGPYRELLFVPGAFKFGDGRRHWSVSRIFVSTPESAINGERNWGLPKQLADFRLEHDGNGGLSVEVSKNGHAFAQLAFAPRRLSLPFHSSMLPTNLRTLGQRMDDIDFVCMPELSGRMRAARLLRAQADAAVFPDIGRGRVIATAALQNFRMQFPSSLLFAAISREADALHLAG